MCVCASVSGESAWATALTINSTDALEEHYVDDSLNWFTPHSF